MGKVIKAKIRGMNLWAKVALTVLSTFAVSVFMYEGWYKPRFTEAAITTVTGNSWSQIYTNTNAFPGTVAYTVNAGSNTTRMLVVAVSASVDTAGTKTCSVTYGGQSMNQVTADGGSTQAHTYIFYLNEAGLDAATNTNLVFTWGGTPTASVVNVFATVYDGVDQSASPITSSLSGTGTTSVALPSNLTIASGDQAVEVVNMSRTGGTTYRTITTPATGWTSVLGPLSTNDATLYNSSYILTDTTAGTTTAGHTISSTTASIYAMSAMSIKAATSDTTRPTVDTFTATTPTTASLAIPITSFTASDNIAVTGYAITTSSSPPTAVNPPSGVWSSTAPTTYTVAADGTYTLYPWAEDAAGNVSLVFGSPRTVVVDTTHPTVSSTSPTNGATGVAPNTSIQVTWSENIDCATVTASDLTINGTTVGTPTCSAPTNTATFPVSGQASSTVYNASINGVSDINGNAMSAAYSFSYTTSGAVCTANAPSVALVPTSSVVKSGQGTVYTVTVTNNDTAACTATTFSLNLTNTNLTQFTSSAIAPTSLNLAPGANGNASFTITANGNAPDGATNSSTVTVTAASHANGVNSATTTVNNTNSFLMHNSINLGTKYGTWGNTKDCSWCHSATANNNNVKRVLANISTPIGRKPVVFTRMTASLASTNGVFGDDTRTYNTNNSTNVCEVCHHQTTYHQYSSSKILAGNKNHYNRKDCTGCHPHGDGFKPGGCDGCHGNPPTTSTATLVYSPSATLALGNPPTTGGAHLTHTGAPENMTCNACHSGNTMPTVSTTIQMGFDVNGTTWPGFAGTVAFGTFSGRAPLGNGYTWAASKSGTLIGTSASYRTSCNVYCHGNWTGANGSMNPSWIITDGSQKVCGTCHGGTASQPPQTGTHTTHASSSAGNYGFSCTKCHPNAGSGAAVTFSHVDGSVQWRLSTATNGLITAGATYRGQTSSATGAVAPSASFGSCANIYCHSTVQGTNGSGVPSSYTTPTWGGAVLGCNGCHADMAGASGTGDHVKHANTYAFVCATCHGTGYTATSITTSTHVNRNINLSFTGTVATGTNYSKTTSFVAGSAVYGSCSTSYCHSNAQGAGGTGAVTYAQPTWGSTVTNCGSCHANMVSGGTSTSGDHYKHAQLAGIACALCHSTSYTSTSVPTGAGTKHVDRFINVTTSGISVGTHYSKGTRYNPGLAYGSCTTSYCHSNVQGAAGSGNPSSYAVPTWGQTATTCGSCHADMATTNTATTLPGNHRQHATASGTVYTCDVCHGAGYTATTVVYSTAPHVNKQVNLTFTGTGAGTTYGKGTAINLPSSTGNSNCTTSPCHGAMNPVWGTAPSTKQRCEKCHGYRVSPWDALNGATANTDAKAGAHFNHISSSGTVKYASPMSCKSCHRNGISLPTDNVNTAGHFGTGPADIVFATLTTGATAAYNTANGTCTNIYCHGVTLPASNPARTNPVWNTPFLTGAASTLGDGVAGGSNPGSGDCSRCHGYPPQNGHNATGCNGCHTHLNADNRTFNNLNLHVNGTVEGASCDGCHGNPPTSTTSLVYSPQATLALGNPPTSAGAHAMHVTTEGMTCTVCHSGNTMPTVSKTIQMGFEVTPSTWPGFAGSAVYGSFSGHSPLGGSGPAYTWAASKAGTIVNTSTSYRTSCNVYCHGNWTGANGSLNASWIGGSADAACGTCHGASGNQPPQTGTHTTHAASSAGNYGYSCTKCHPNARNGAAVNFNHVNGSVQWRLSTSANGLITAGATYRGQLSSATGVIAPSASFGSCANIYCHSNAQGAGGTGAITYTTPTWGGAALSCGGCHANMATGGTSTSGDHYKHAQTYSFACATCHGTGYTATSITTSTHVNRNIDLGFTGTLASGTTYSSGMPTHAPGTAYGSCSTSYCHSNGQSDLARAPIYRTPTWGTTVTNCGSCHNNMKTFANSSSGSHVIHTLSTNANYDCAICHGTGYTATSITTSTHVNRKIDLGFTGNAVGTAYSKYSAAGFAPGKGVYGTCASNRCHGGAAVRIAWGGDTTRPTCFKCHGSTATTGFVSVTSASVAPGGGTAGRDLAGNTTASAARLGAHQPHMTGASNISDTVHCRACHVQVNTFADAAHLNYTTATMTFSGLATAQGHSPTVSRVSGLIQCSNTYCHTALRPAGAGAGQGGLNNTPAWNNIAFLGNTSTADTCTNKCHAMPPGAGVTGDTHQSLAVISTIGQLSNCSSQSPGTGCHPTLNGAPTTIGNVFFDKLLHINGQVEGGDCISCHGTTQTITKGPLSTGGNLRRAVSNEFMSTWSHARSKNRSVTKFDCIACHMEGDPSTGDRMASYHGNGYIELRDPDTGLTIQNVTWVSNGSVAGGGFYTNTGTPMNTWAAFRRNLGSATIEPEVAAMQINFCLKCHDSDGALSTLARVGGAATSALRPFNVTVLDWTSNTAMSSMGNATNGAGNIVNVKASFMTSNASYHPVMGKGNNGFAKGLRMVAPWNGIAQTVGTASFGYLISCWDCHASTGATGLQTFSVTAHGAPVTLRGGFRNTQTAGTTATNNFCFACHVGVYGGGNNHASASFGTSAFNSGGSSMTSHLPTCFKCHGTGIGVSSISVAGSSTLTTISARPLRAQDVHGFNDRYANVANSTWASGNRPYAFIRNVLTSWRPARSPETTTNTSGACTGISGRTCDNNMSGDTYSPGGNY